MRKNRKKLRLLALLLAALTLCLHLLFHCVLNFSWRKNILKLNSLHLDAPPICGFIKNCCDPCVDNVTGSERSLKIKVTNNVSECCCRQIFNS